MRFCLVAVVCTLLPPLCSLAEEPLAFPGAQGFAAHTPAGRGGRVLRVTSLESAGPGTLREALESKGPRIIVFEVGGVIDLKKKGLRIEEPFLTIAGQTAPALGVTIIRGPLSIRTHDVLVQHLRVRPGDAGMPKKSGWSPDGISTFGEQAYNVIIDHCSTTWAVDENLSTSGPLHKGPEGTTHNVTLSNCIIAEGLNNSSHEKGAHSKGSLIHDHCTNIAILGNLYAHNADRNPLFKGGTTGAVVNNLIYDPGFAAMKINWVPEEYAGSRERPENGRISVVGNAMYHGPSTKSTLALVATMGRADVYLEDNIAQDRDGKTVAMVSGAYTALTERPVWPAGLKALPAAEVFEHVLRHAGARPVERDEIDRRIVQSVRNKTGRIIDSQEDVGGYPQVPSTSRKLDIPVQEIDQWLARLAAAVE